ncbi:MAG: UbiA family prenyltransferase, partial [Pseudomonadota bacterium]
MDDAARAEPPLVVDLDDTLVRTDLLFEGLLTHLGQQPGDLRRLPGWLASGKAGFKRRLAERASPEIETLPLNSDVVAQIEASRAVGQRVVLVTASDQIYADQVAEMLGLFDEVHGSDGQRNLGGAEKARFLEERFGRGGYDYIGDSKRDLPVWAAGRHAYTVGRAQRLSVSAGGEVKPLGGPSPRGAWLRAIRPHQWLKNALIAVPMLTAFQLEATTLAMVLVAFVCFSLTASSVYLINDLLDLADDRRHPRKSKRPFAAGDLGIRDGLFLAAGLIVSAFSLALAAMPLGFIAVLGIYYAATFAYSLALKRRSVLDVCTLAGLYSMRVI